MDGLDARPTGMNNDHRTRRRRYVHVAVAITLAGGAWQPIVAASTASDTATMAATGRAATMSPVVRPETGPPNAPTTVAGKVPGRAKRTVVLQRKTQSAAWSTATRGKSTRRGTYKFKTTTSPAPGVVSWRVKAPRAKLKTKRGVRIAKRFVSSVVTTRVVAAVPTPTPTALPTATPTQTVEPTATPTSSPTTNPPPTPPTPYQRSVQLAEGSQALVALSPDATRTEIVEVSGAPAGVHLQGVAEGLLLEAALEAPAGESTLVVRAVQCSIDETCAPVAVDLALEVVPLTQDALLPDDGLIHGITWPSSDRIEDAQTLEEANAKALADEVLVTVREGLGPEEATAIAESVAAGHQAVVSGGFPDLGVFELRWTQAIDLNATLNSVEAHADIDNAVPTLLDDLSVDVAPEEWGNTNGFNAGWPLRAIRAQQAWDVTPGGGSEPVGVVDVGVAQKHQDLRATNLTVPGLASRGGGHATHVAGSACAVQDGQGIVGASWGCKTYHTGVGEARDFWKGALAAAEELINRAPVRVVNMSLGINAGKNDDTYCATRATNAQIEIRRNAAAPLFEALFSRGRGAHVVWTLSAGNNCAPTPSSPMGAHWQLDNVITVAATNQDGRLASFSNFGTGVEVAAPGGVDDSGLGVVSTGYDQTPCSLVNACYYDTYGTSMAAPVVAGVAQLMFTANPDLDAAQVGRCLTTSAVQQVPSRSTQPAPDQYRMDSSFSYPANSLNQIDARRAVDCAVSYEGFPLPANEAIGGLGRAMDMTPDARFLLAGTGGNELVVRDNELGTIDFVSVDQSGEPLGSPSEGSISADGRYVAFSACLDGCNSGRQIFLHDRRLGATTLLSRTASGVPGTGSSEFPAISDDGQTVVFSTRALNLVPPTQPSNDTYIARHRVGRGLDVLSGTRGGYYPAIDATGRTISFASTYRLTSDDRNIWNDIFVLRTDTGRVRRVQGDLPEGTTGTSSVSASGRYIAFQSAASDVFVYDHDTNRSIRVSGPVPVGYGGWHFISGNGRYVVYESNTKTYRGIDIGEGIKVFRADRATGKIVLLSSPAGILNEGPAINGDGTKIAVQASLGGGGYILSVPPS